MNIETKYEVGEKRMGGDRRYACTIEGKSGNLLYQRKMYHSNL